MLFSRDITYYLLVTYFKARERHIGHNFNIFVTLHFKTRNVWTNQRTSGFQWQTVLQCSLVLSRITRAESVAGSAGSREVWCTRREAGCSHHLASCSVCPDEIYLVFTGWAVLLLSAIAFWCVIVVMCAGYFFIFPVSLLRNLATREFWVTC